MARGGGMVRLTDLRTRLDARPGVVQFVAHLCDCRGTVMGTTQVYSREEADKIAAFLAEHDPGGLFHDRGQTGTGSESGSKTEGGRDE